MVFFLQDGEHSLSCASCTAQDGFQCLEIAFEEPVLGDIICEPFHGRIDAVATHGMRLQVADACGIEPAYSVFRQEVMDTFDAVVGFAREVVECPDNR